MASVGAAAARSGGGLTRVVIVGRPNVGKSSLFNWLVEKRVAIEDPTAGVTRDQYVSRKRASSPQTPRSMPGQGRCITSQPPSPSPTACPSASTISGTTPGKGSVQLPGFVGTAPGIGEIMMPPVSVCHQVSTTGMRPLPTSW